MALLPDQHNRYAAVLRKVLCLPLILLCCAANAQTKQLLLQGNKNYDQKKYDEAAVDYDKAIKKDPNNVTGYFNLGNTLYQQQKYDSSRKLMTATEKKMTDKKGKAAANYNIGNSYMSQQKWEDAINSYKQTLRTNPQDADAKYNLAYAQQMLKKQQQQQQQQNKQDKQNKDQKDKQKQQEKDKDKDKDQKDQKGQQDKDQQDKQQEPQSKPSTMSKQDAENQLNQLEQMQKKLEDKMNKEKGVPVKLDKDW